MSKPATRATSADVATAAGVSRTTVSLVLNDRAGTNIPEATRERVRTAASELGYAPSAAAASLRRGRSSIVLLLMPDRTGSRNSSFLHALTPAFARQGLTLVTYLRSGRPDEARELWSSTAPAAVLSLDALDSQLLEELERSGVGVVLNLSGAAGQDQRGLSSLESEIGRCQAEHLIARGHRRLGFAAPSTDQGATPDGRLAGVRQACQAHGLPDPREAPVALTTDGAVDAVREWCAAALEPVTAICAYNDDHAMAVLAAAHALGLQVPGALAVIGVDDNPTSALTVPALSTVAYVMEAVGEFLAATVSAQLSGGPTPVMPDLGLAIHLVERAST